MAWARQGRQVWVFLAAVALACVDAHAAEKRLAPAWHLYFGSDIATNSFFGYGGLIWSPRGTLHESGMRVMLAGNGGTYDYVSMGRRFSGEEMSGEVLAGYQWILDGWGATVWAGPAIARHEVTPFDPGNRKVGTKFGAKAKVEAYRRLSETVLANATASYSTATEGYAFRVSMAVEVMNKFTLEPEAAIYGDPNYYQVRAGVLAEVWRGETNSVYLGGGFAYDDDGPGFYAGLHYKRWYAATAAP